MPLVAAHATFSRSRTRLPFVDPALTGPIKADALIVKPHAAIAHSVRLLRTVDPAMALLAMLRLCRRTIAPIEELRNVKAVGLRPRFGLSLGLFWAVMRTTARQITEA